MITSTDKSKENKDAGIVNQVVANTMAENSVAGVSLPFNDNRPEMISQRKLQYMVNNSYQAKQFKVFQNVANVNPQENNFISSSVQRVPIDVRITGNELLQKKSSPVNVGSEVVQRTMWRWDKDNGIWVVSYQDPAEAQGPVPPRAGQFRDEYVETEPPAAAAAVAGVVVGGGAAAAAAAVAPPVGGGGAAAAAAADKSVAVAANRPTAGAMIEGDAKILAKLNGWVEFDAEGWVCKADPGHTPKGKVYTNGKQFYGADKDGHVGWGFKVWEKVEKNNFKYCGNIVWDGNAWQYKARGTDK